MSTGGKYAIMLGFVGGYSYTHIYVTDLEKLGTIKGQFPLIPVSYMNRNRFTVGRKNEEIQLIQNIRKILLFKKKVIWRKCHDLLDSQLKKKLEFISRSYRIICSISQIWDQRRCS